MIKWLIIFMIVIVLAGVWLLMKRWSTNEGKITSPAKIYTWWSYKLRDGMLPKEGQTVLFFHADWCSACVRVEKVFETFGVPGWLHIRRVDYDDEIDLRKKYNVTTQTTFVAIDKSGEMITRWIGARDVEDILDHIGTMWVEKPREKIAREGSDERHKAVFAGGCFWCMEWPFEALNGVKSVVAGYAGWSVDDASYDAVSSGVTKHREAIQVIYDPALISYEDLLDVFRRQIDPTDDGGQFADRGFHYTTAIYYTTSAEQKTAEHSRNQLEESKKFDSPIVTKVLPFETFFPAEEHHQNYYLKQSDHYDRYKKWSGRAGFIDDNRWDEGGGLNLTELQRRVTQEWYTERPFDNEYRDEKREWIYVDIIDGTPLFSSTDKFDSGTGRPSFTKPLALEKIDDKIDTSHGMMRTEVKSSGSDAHLGHVFNDGPGGSQRYCINSAALRFVPREEMKLKGYGEYLSLFE